MIAIDESDRSGDRDRAEAGASPRKSVGEVLARVAQEVSGMNTEPHYILNHLLSLLYPDAGTQPCAECVRRIGETPRGDCAGRRALVCTRCARLDACDRNFAIMPHEQTALAKKGVTVEPSMRMWPTMGDGAEKEGG